MKSMTGFAKKQCTLRNKRHIIEIKTLNSKQLDLNVKVTATLRDKELPIRTLLNRLERGKIDCYITEEVSEETGGQLNSALLSARYAALMECCHGLDRGNEISPNALMQGILSQPEVWQSTTEESLTDEEWNTLAKAIDEAIDEVDNTRSHEGAVLRNDFVKHIDLIESKMLQLPNYEPERVEIAKERIRQWLRDSGIKDADENRFEQELIYYLEKLDITEEKVRLAKHIDYFREVMDHEPSCGKKLTFIAQEMGREINTTGSKANHVEIQRLVVEMKDELEKIKEQLGNIL
ncbi:MAG: YicC family protein [Bacteroidales bacterium]|nr:YicC family protein [Bacteroidales bacterium]